MSEVGWPDPCCAVEEMEILTAPAATCHGMSALALRVRGEFEEMPGLTLTAPQAARLFGMTADVAHAVLDELRRASVLACSNRGTYSLVAASPRHHGAREPNDETTTIRRLGTSAVDGSLRNASVDRLACLLRHWAWANEARERFEQELAAGWESDENPVADHPFGSYYHWCALLCGFSDAALEQGLLSPRQLNMIRRDLEMTLPGLRACRELLVVIPASREEQPRVADLLRDEDTLGRLRRLHDAFGAALRAERMSRAIDSLDS